MLHTSLVRVTVDRLSKQVILLAKQSWTNQTTVSIKPLEKKEKEPTCSQFRITLINCGNIEV